MVNIDYNVDPKKIINEIKIPIQGGLDPKVLLTDKENLHTEVKNIFKFLKITLTYLILDMVFYQKQKLKW